VPEGVIAAEPTPVRSNSGALHERLLDTLDALEQQVTSGRGRRGELRRDAEISRLADVASLRRVGVAGNCTSDLQSESLRITFEVLSATSTPHGSTAQAA